jgi:GNAT superfamily N-acetyltransferase
MTLAIRLAVEADLPALKRLMDRAIDTLLSPWLNADQVRASHAIMGLDTQLIADRTYFVVTTGDAFAGCGGWSRRATLYGGDHSTDLREPRLLDPRTESARVRAMYTDPAFVRRGVGRLILQTCEEAARIEGFASAELMATMAGEPLYVAAGYQPIEHVTDASGGAPVPLIRMRKRL